MDKFGLRFCWLFSFVLAQSTHAFGQPLTLQDVLTKVLQVNPRLQSFGSLVKARQGAAQQAEVRLNPNLGVIAGNRVQELNFDQELEYPGKRRARTLAAAAEIEMAEAERQLVALELQQETAGLFYAILWGERNIQLLQQHLDVTQQFLQAATYKFDQGFGSELDVVKAQVEVVRARRLLQAAQQQHLASQSKLKTLLKIPFTQSLELQDELSISRLAAPVNPDSLLQQALRSFPAAQIAEAGLKAAQYRVDMARLSSKPNFNIGLEGGVDDKEATASVNLSIPLALQDKKKGAQLEAQFEQQSREYDLENTRNNIIQQVTTAYQEYRTAIAAVNLFDTTLLRKAQDAAQAAQRAFETSGFRLLDLIDAQRTYLDTMLEYYESLLSLRQAEVDLQIASGTPIVRGQ